MCGFDVEHASVALNAPGKRILVSFGESLPEWNEREPGHTLHNGLAFLLSFRLACEIREARCTSLSLCDRVADAEGRAARSDPRCRRPGYQRRSTRGCLTTQKWTVSIFLYNFGVESGNCLCPATTFSLFLQKVISHLSKYNTILFYFITIEIVVSG